MASLRFAARRPVQASMADYRTSKDRVFACGDMRRGQSLVVWAIREGRDCAAAVNAFLLNRAGQPVGSRGAGAKFARLNARDG
jgi:glutamate synthase (NADPH/NADH) small chain